MSEEQLKAFIAKAKEDTSIQEKLKAAKTAADVVGIAKEHGHEFTADRLTNGGGPACANMCIQTNMLPTNRQAGPC